tara:strand:- start:3594 stop:3962 length:369 start_codon:yes stop_codon:yes gene_type:complete
MRAAVRGLEGDPQAGAPPLAGGGAAAHTPRKRIAHQWLSAASLGRIPGLGLGDGLSVRRHRRWLLTQVPECDRRAPPEPRIRVGRCFKAKDVVAALEELTSLYLPPAFIRSDNDSEFIAHAP